MPTLGSIATKFSTSSGALMVERVTVPVHYRAGHTYVLSLVPADMFCPACAGRTVWVEDSDGDFYQGPTHYCAACGCEFCIQGPTPPYTGTSPSDNVAGQVVAALREHLFGNSDG